MKRTLTFKEYLSKKMLPYKIAFPVSLSLMTALFAAYAILVFYSENDRSFVKAISPHISTLVETQDGPELQRFINSVADEKNVIIYIEKNDEVIASSSDNTLIGKPYHVEGIKVIGIDSDLSMTYLISKTGIKREGGPSSSKGSIYLLNPILDLFSMVLAVAIIVFILSFILLNILATKIISVAQKSIEPIKDLENSIYELKKFGEILVSRPAGREAYLAMSAYLTKGLPKDETIEIDFSGVKVLTPSWADEVITKIALDFKNLKLVNTANPTVKATLKTLMEYSGLKLSLNW